MNNKYIFIVASLVIGGVLGYSISKVTADTKPAVTQNTIMDHSMMSMTDTMDSMSAGLKGKSGDEFDQAFIKGMIDHHQGAIDMANMALQNAKHDEIQTMAKDIISAQSREIGQMKEWQNNWYNK